MEIFLKINTVINQIVWGPFMLCVLLLIGIFYSIKLKFFQIRDFKLWWSETFLSLFHSESKKNTKDKISPFQAMATALAGAIGTGNIVGVAGAVTLGGAGAIFWMWVASFFGMATIYAENILGILYRKKVNGKFVGGPMYYIEYGLKNKPLAVIFAVFCTLAALGMGNMTQANSISVSVQNSFSVPVQATGIMVAVLSGIIIFGGINRIASLTEKLIPVIAVLYTILCFVIIILNIQKVPYAFFKIFEQAFDIKSAAGGFLGYGMARAIKYGISRGVFSNEAGLGSSPIIYSASETDHPVKQGFWGVFQVFIDTIVLCTLMALCIITTGLDESHLDGVSLSTATFENNLGLFGKYFIAVSIILFAFATLVSWSYYGEKSLEYLFGNKLVILYRIIYILFIYLGSIIKISAVWEISDTLNGLMAIPNLIALIFLSKKINYSEIRRFK